MGISSGDELLDSLPEVGQNFFNEAEGHSGGVNSVRGDVGAYNLRNMGTGNTLVLLKLRGLPDRGSGWCLRTGQFGELQCDAGLWNPASRGPA
jgi:hypothetical protein